MSKIKVPLSNGSFLIAEANTEQGYKEIFIGIEKDNAYWQDLVIVGEKYHYDNDHDGPVADPGKYTVHVFSDDRIDDYTHEFIVDQYKEEEP